MAGVDLGIEGLVWQATLGRGGSGTVYQAFDEAHGRTVAVKILDTSLDETSKRRFDRERRAMGSVGSHPNIITVLTSGVSAHDRPYLVMEQMPGGSLADRLRSGPLAVDEVIDIGLRLADALDAAHRAGIVHCDVKPANVLLAQDHRPILSDFGIASVASDRSMRVTVSATPSFAAPEILQGRDPDQRSDIYSLAATLFACLEGHPPYGSTSETMLGVLYQIINDPVPTATRDDTPPAVIAALRHTMAKEPGDRPADMMTFANELRGNHVTSTTGSAPVDRPAVPNPSAAPDHRAPVVPEPSNHQPDRTEPEPSDRRGHRSLLTIVVGAALALIALVGAAGATRGWFGGETQVDVPDVSDLALADAVTVLEERGLAVEHEPACESAVARASTPEGGTRVDPATTVDLVIDPCVVPNFVGIRLPDAIDLIMTIDGLSISWDDYCDDLVLGQEPAEGTAVDFGSTIAIELRAC